MIEQAVIKRLMTDVPFGVLLSGGLDSSLVATVASRYLNETEAANVWGAQLHTFSVGLEVMIDFDYYLKALNMIPTQV
jgi:asparagine synthase (glutamine-hydrolysing)